MTDEKGIVRAYSKDRQTYRPTAISIKRKSLTQFTRTSENYYSNRNCPELLSIYALTNKHLDSRKHDICHSVSNDTHYFSMINYPIQSPPPTPIPNLVLQNDDQQEKETKFPKVTPRSTSVTGKRFPTLTSRGSTSIVGNKNPIPTIRTSVKSTPSVYKKPLQSKTPITSTDKKKKK